MEKITIGTAFQARYICILLQVKSTSLLKIICVHKAHAPAIIGATTLTIHTTVPLLSACSIDSTSDFLHRKIHSRSDPPISSWSRVIAISTVAVKFSEDSLPQYVVECFESPLWPHIVLPLQVPQDVFLFHKSWLLRPAM